MTFLTTSEAAKRLGISPSTLRNWRTRPGFGPAFYRFSGTRVRYAAEDVDQWASARRVNDVAANANAPGMDPERA